MFAVNETTPDIAGALARSVQAFNRAHGTTWAVHIGADGTCEVEDGFTHRVAVIDFAAERPLPATARCAARLWNEFAATPQARG